jgi:hypothetical protein
MRLTNFLRDAFIRAAMHDVPKIDYQEQAHKMAREFIQTQFKKDFPTMDYQVASDSGWFESGSISMPHHIDNFYVKISRGYGMVQADEKLWAKLEALSNKKQEQDKNIRVLEARLKGVAYACTTRKQLQEALPEFTSYLPEEEAKAARDLPVVVNVVSDFVKAGWPKQNKGKIAAAKAAA